MIRLEGNEYGEVLDFLGKDQALNVMMISLINQYQEKEDLQVYGEYEHGEIQTVVMNHHNKMYLYSTKEVQLKPRFVKNMIRYVNAKNDIIKWPNKKLKGFKKRTLNYAELSSCKDNYVDENIIEISSIRELRKYYQLLESIDELDLIKYPDRETFLSVLIEEIEHQYVRVLVYEINGEYVSTLSIKAENQFGAMIKKVATKKAYRHHGYASKLLQWAASDVVHTKQKKLYLFYENKTIAPLYEQIGFKQIDHWCMLVRK